MGDEHMGSLGREALRQGWWEFGIVVLAPSIRCRHFQRELRSIFKAALAGWHGSRDHWRRSSIGFQRVGSQPTPGATAELRGGSKIGDNSLFETAVELLLEADGLACRSACRTGASLAPRGPRLNHALDGQETWPK